VQGVGAGPAFTFVLALAAGVAAQSLARHLRVPGIVILLLAGAGLGPDGLGWVQPGELGEGLPVLVELAVAVILFEGGLNLQISRLRREQAPIRRLVLGGVLVTLLGAALAARVLLGWSWITALVFGSLVAVTGPTVIGPLLAALRLRPRLATVLSAEGVLIDPVGAILAVLLLEVALAPSADTVASAATVFLGRAGFGAAAGVAGGFVLARLLQARRLVPEGFPNIVSLGFVLLLFQACEVAISHSGLLAVTLAGVVVGNLPSQVDRDLREFKDQLTVLLIGLLFVLLAASVRLEDVADLGWRGLGVVACLVLVVRPVVVWLATSGSDFSVREKLLLGWLAPRGIVAAAVASATAVALDRAGVGGGPELLAMVFLVIAVTVLLAGATGLPVASLLGQRLPGREGVAILGAEGLGLLLADRLRAGGASVVFLDSNPMNCRRAEELGFPVVFGDTLLERTLQRARIETVGMAVGATPNQVLNGVFVSRTRERFSVPAGLIAVDRTGSGLGPELIGTGRAQVLFEGPHDLERWDVRARHGAVDVETWVWTGGSEKAAARRLPAPAPGGSESLAILTVARGGRTVPMSADRELRSGDTVSVAVHRDERAAAHQRLRELGFEPGSAPAPPSPRS
jgi:NhaP-type Na+/H+ or K+/H+ antiporter/Trk K+ transport system NAD-binding subunit